MESPDSTTLSISKAASSRACTICEVLRSMGCATLISCRTMDTDTEKGGGLRENRVSFTVETHEGQWRLFTKMVLNLDSGGKRCSVEAMVVEASMSRMYI